MSEAITYPGYGVSKPSVAIEELNFTDGPVESGSVAVQITHNGICHSDIHMLLDEWKGHGAAAIYPLCPGHEAIGRVTHVAPDVTHLKVGDRVGFGPQRNSCRQCDLCQIGDENICIKGTEGLYSPKTGGFGSHIRAPAHFAFKIPDEIPSEYAGPLMCAGVTVFSPLRKHPLAAGSKVAVVGIGGLGHLAVQYAAAMGYEVTAITRSLEKAEQIKAYGAKDILVSTDAEAMKASASKFHMILNTVSATIPADVYLNLLRPNGKLICMGVGEVSFSVNPFVLLTGNRQIIGSMIGGTEDMKAMLEFSAKHKIFPTIEVVEAPFGQNSADKVTAAVKKVLDNKARFRMVLDYKVE